MRIASKIFRRLESETRHVFFVPGGGAMYLVDALGKSKLTSIPTIHEQGAGFAAIGHSMFTNRLGVCLITSGPGVIMAAITKITIIEYLRIFFK